MATDIGGGVDILARVAVGWRCNAFVFRVPPSAAGVLGSLFSGDGTGTGPTDSELTVLREGVCAVHLCLPGGGAPLVRRMRAASPVSEASRRVDLVAAVPAYSSSPPLWPV